MNACLRSVVRNAVFHGFEVIGVRNGYDGLIKQRVMPLNLRSVGNIIQRGGTFLGSSRSTEFRTTRGRAQAYSYLKALDVGALITLGGDGTLSGAGIFSQEFPIQVIGVPSSIDNDLCETDLSLGFDTAVNTAVECIDRIRDTADSHGRIFVVEVMGKSSGHIALETALAAGAEYAVIPESKLREKDLVRKIQQGVNRGKSGSIVIVAEKKDPGYALDLSKVICRHVKRDVRAVVLGHLQRGGSPSRIDRNLASRFGAKAVELVRAKKTRLMVAVQDDEIVAVPFQKVVGKRRYADLSRLKLVDTLSI